MIEKYAHLFSFNSELNEKLVGTPFYEYVKPVTLDELDLFEKEYEIALPDDFKLFYSETNGLSRKKEFGIGIPFKTSRNRNRYFELEGLDPISMNNTLATSVNPNYYPEMDDLDKSDYEEYKVLEKVKSYLTLTQNTNGTYLLMGIHPENCGEMYVIGSDLFVFKDNLEYPFKITNSFTEFLDNLKPLSLLNT